MQRKEVENHVGGICILAAQITCISCCLLAEPFPGIWEPKLVEVGFCGFVCLLLGGGFIVPKQKRREMFYLSPIFPHPHPSI